MKIMIINIEDRAYAEIKEDTEKFRSNGMVIPYLYKVIESGIPISIQSIGAEMKNVADFMYTMDIRLGELLSLFLQGYDDKVYIDLYNGTDSDEIFEDIRIIDGRLNEYLNRKVTGLDMGERLGIYIERR